MVVLVDLAQCVANLEMCLVIIGPVLLAAVHRDAAVRALEIDMRRGHCAPWLVVMVWAPRMLSYEGRAPANLWDWGVGEGVEEVIG
jgi:hypothetical protein